MAEDQVAKLEKELADLIKTARAAVNELTSLSRTGIPGQQGFGQGGGSQNVNRPGVAGSTGSGSPITGSSGTPGMMSVSDMVIGGTALFSRRNSAVPHMATQNQRGLSLEDGMRIAKLGGGKARPDMGPFAFSMPSGPAADRLIAEVTGMPNIPDPQASGVHDLPTTWLHRAYGQQRAYDAMPTRYDGVLYHPGRPTGTYDPDNYINRMHAFGRQVGEAISSGTPMSMRRFGILESAIGARPGWRGWGARAAAGVEMLFNPVENEGLIGMAGRSWAGVKEFGQSIGPKHWNDRVFDVQGPSMGNGRFMDKGSAAYNAGRWAGRMFGKYGGIAAAGLVFAQAGMEMYDSYYAYATQMKGFEGRRDTLLNRQAREKLQVENYASQESTSLGASLAAVALVSGPLGLGTVGQAVAAHLVGKYGAEAATEMANQTGKMLHSAFGFDAGNWQGSWLASRTIGMLGNEFRNDEEKRKAAIREMAKQLSLGDLDHPADQAGKWLDDSHMTLENFAERVGLAHRRAQAAYEAIALGNTHNRMISGEFKGEMPEEMMKNANDMVQGSCPNWANAGQVYAMFEAGRMAARNFARSQSARGQQRTGD